MFNVRRFEEQLGSTGSRTKISIYVYTYLVCTHCIFFFKCACVCVTFRTEIFLKTDNFNKWVRTLVITQQETPKLSPQLSSVVFVISFFAHNNETSEFVIKKTEPQYNSCQVSCSFYIIYSKQMVVLRSTLTWHRYLISEEDRHHLAFLNQKVWPAMVYFNR